MITQSFDLNLIPKSAPVVVHCDQYDHGTGRLVVSLYDGDVAYSPSGTAVIQGIKPDNKGFNYSCTLSGNTVTADLTEQMSAVAGRVRCQIVVTETTGRTGSFVFVLDVQRSALPADSDMSESDYQLIKQAIEDAQQAVSDAEGYSEDAEAWAVGERGGVPVPSSDPTYNNNSEYWAGIAQQYAQGGVHYKGSILFANIPTTGMVDGDMYNIQNDFTTDSRFAEGSGINCPAGTNIVWNGSKWDLFALVKMGALSDLTDVSINTPTDGQGLVYDGTLQDWVNGDVSVSEMTTAVKGIGKPDGITTDVTSGTFRAKGVGIVADVNSGGTAYGSDWLYYTGTTTVIVPSTEQMYRVVVSGTASLYYWNGTNYAPLTSSSSSGVSSFNGRTGAVVPANGDYALNNMSDVSISTPSAGQVLGYDGNGWKNTAAPGGGGSIINVTTSESSLYGKTVTLTDGTTTLSTTFDNSGKAQFTGVTLTGNLTISSSNGTSTATGTLTVNYFGVYTKTLSFFTAYLTVTFPASVGATCTVNGVTATTSPHTFTVNSQYANYDVVLDGYHQMGGVTLTDGQTKSVTVEYGTINLTYANEFRGQSITCTQGGTTITKTAPSAGNSLAFYPPTTGSWVVSGTYSGATYSKTATVSSLSTPVSVTLETVPDGSTTTPTDDIQKWLACAQITGKSYTTLSQVLADSETYNRLLSDSNACDYMKRSTTWASTIVADANAMVTLGKYDYACDTLLSDSTWASAIANSTYFESVLDVKVPTMTSNTTPSGECSASDESQQNAYKAFDGNSSDWWNTNNSTNQWVAYEFTSPVCVTAISLIPDNSSSTSYDRIKNFKVQGYDNGDWEDIYTGIAQVTTSAVEQSFSFANNKSYAKYRIYVLDSYSGKIGLRTLQFYGRHEAQTDIVVAPPQSQVYYMQNGSPVTLCTTDNDGIGTVDWSSLPKGNITLYNTVAKDPDNLSNDYSKTVAITENTTEIYLMPDNALEWFGWESSNLEDCSTANGWTDLIGNRAWASPTHNINDVTLSSTSGSSNVGIGNKYSITYSKLIAIVTPTTNQGNDVLLKGITAKASLSVTAPVTYSSGTSLQKIEVTPTNVPDDGYAVIVCTNGRKGKVSALLYE